MRELIGSVLTARGFEVEVIRDGASLLRHLGDPCGPGFDGQQRGGPNPAVDLVISDVQMPGVDGLDVLRRLRAGHEAPPVILITAFGDVHLHRRARELGAVDVIDKPFDLMQLCARVECVLRRKMDRENAGEADLVRSERRGSSSSNGRTPLRELNGVA